jgi:hypothetical protein
MRLKKPLQRIWPVIGLQGRKKVLQRLLTQRIRVEDGCVDHHEPPSQLRACRSEGERDGTHHAVAP